MLDLTPTGWRLLVAVAAAPERVFSRYELVNRVRGYEYAGYERTMRLACEEPASQAQNIRGDVLETVLGVGYRLRLRRAEAG